MKIAEPKVALLPMKIPFITVPGPEKSIAPP